ncbi:winged helix-turn-helix domain-containing protein [Luteolibacter sp. Populi]|uniref:winged helix-turn-helix domain-containing protein n=1 Tax=Luteolibacter sp. Populi TaxID=3230487 RepID=UPI003467B6F6
MENLTLSIAEARAIALRSQGLAEEAAPFGAGREAALEAIRHLGYVQMDTISVIQRAHHHVLWSRIPDYDPEMLDALQSTEASVFEYWNHASSYLPTRDYRFSLPLMRKHRKEMHWSEESPELRKAMRRLMARIRSEGALAISDVEATTMVRQWSNDLSGKIERRAFHELWIRGDVMIRSRRGVQKVFDLPERVLPAATELKPPSKREAADFHLRRGLRALGIARMQELHYLRDGGHATEVRQALAGLIKKGEVIEARVEGFPAMPVFLLREALALATPLTASRIRFLSPFDNLTIQRKRMAWLFGFDYTVEIYVPAAKRKYGYFVLPVLWGDRVIGRFDAKAHRKERRLSVINLVFEPGFAELGGIEAGFKEALDEFARFQGCDHWEILRVEPAGWLLSSR